MTRFNGFCFRCFKNNYFITDPDELCHRLKLFLQEKYAGNNSNIINDEFIAIVDKLLEYRCMSKKQPKQTLIKCNLLHE